MGRVDPPEEHWAGRMINEDDVGMACGDERDWFTPGMRLEAFDQGLGRYRKARKYKRNMGSKFKFAQIMLIGDMGASKTTLAAWESYKHYQRGHPVFHNGCFLFGRIVDGAGIYEIVDKVPRNSVIAIDEAHTGLESGMAASSGVRSFTILCAGLRKKNCRLILMTAMAVMVARKIRDMCSEAWRPMRPNVEASDFGYGGPAVPGHSNPKNFIFCWDVWRDFPFRGEDLTSAKARKRGFGPSDDTRMVMGESVRNAFLLTDSFQPVETAVAQQHAGKASMEQERRSNQGLSDDHRRLIAELVNRLNETPPPSTLNSAVLALKLGLTDAQVGRMMSGIFGDVDGWKKGSSYIMAVIERAIDEKFEISRG